jgi:hypothetical protein
MKTFNRSPRASPLAHEAFRGAHLAEFLNTPSDGPAHVRIAQIFEFERQLESLEPSSRAAGNLRRAINAHCAELRVIPWRWVDGWGWRPAPSIEPRGPVTAPFHVRVTPTFALELISQMASAHMLGRVRQCEVCQKWFFAANGKKVVCDNRCRSAKFKQADPTGFKEKRAADMREWRATLKGHPNLKRKKKPRR